MTTVEYVSMWGYGLKVGDIVIPLDSSWWRGISVVAEAADHGHVKLVAKDGLRTVIISVPEDWAFNVVQLRDESKEEVEPEGFKVPDLTPGFDSEHSMLVSIAFNGDRDKQVYYCLNPEDGRFRYAKGFGATLDSMQDIIDTCAPEDNATLVIHAGAKALDTESIEDKYEEFYRNHIWQDVAGDFYAYDKIGECWIISPTISMHPETFGEAHGSIQEVENHLVDTMRYSDGSLVACDLVCIGPNWEYIKP